MSAAVATTTRATDLLIFGRLELLDAEIAVGAGDVRAAHIKLDLAQAYIAECRKLLPPVGLTPRSQTPDPKP